MAEKEAVLLPEETETDAGTESSGLLLASATVPPLVFVRVTVQALVPALPRVAGAHATELMAGGTTTDMTDPPVPVSGRAFPAGDAATVSVIPNDVAAGAGGRQGHVENRDDSILNRVCIQPGQDALVAGSRAGARNRFARRGGGSPRHGGDGLKVARRILGGPLDRRRLGSPLFASLSVRLAARPEALADERVSVPWASNICEARTTTVNSLSVNIYQLPYRGTGPEIRCATAACPAYFRNGWH